MAGKHLRVIICEAHKIGVHDPILIFQDFS